MGVPCHGRGHAQSGEHEQGGGLAGAALSGACTECKCVPPKSVAIVTTHYAQMLWLQHCVWDAGRRLHGDQAYECVQMIATLDRY